MGPLEEIEEKEILLQAHYRDKRMKVKVPWEYLPTQRPDDSSSSSLFFSLSLSVLYYTALEEYSSVVYYTVQCTVLYYTKLLNIGLPTCRNISFWYGNAEGGKIFLLLSILY